MIMNPPYDYGETLRIRRVYRDPESGALLAQASSTVTITDPDGTETVTDGAMTEESTATYTYNYAIPTDGPKGTWRYAITGTTAGGVLAITTVYFDVKAVVIPFSLPENVRDLLPDILMAEDYIGSVASGTSITLTNPVFGVPSILKDTAILYESTDYTFIQSQAVTLLVAALGENYTVRTHIGFSDVQLRKFITKSDRKIRSIFYNLVEPSAEHRSDWSAMLTAAYVLKITSRGDPDVLSWARSLKADVKEDIAAYLIGEGKSVFDDSGIIRNDATSIGDFTLDQSGSADYGGIDE